MQPNVGGDGVYQVVRYNYHSGGGDGVLNSSLLNSARDKERRVRLTHGKARFKGMKLVWTDSCGWRLVLSRSLLILSTTPYSIN